MLITLLSILGIIVFVGQSQAQVGDIVIEDADSTSKISLYISGELLQASSEVSHRIIIEYADSVSHIILCGPDELYETATLVSPRIIVEYADSISYINQESPQFPKTWFLFSPIIIDKYAVTNKRAEAGSSQRISFHVVWGHNGSSVIGGVIFINETKCFTNTIGWAEINATSKAIGKQTWTITAVDCYGALSFNQLVENPSIIWDQIKISYDLSSITPGVSKITVTLVYAYDNTPINDAEVYIDGSKAIRIGDGTYQCSLSNWSPFTAVDLKIEKQGFNTITTRIQIYHTINLAIFASLIPIPFVAWKGYKKGRRWNIIRKRNELITACQRAILKGEESLLQQLLNEEPKLHAKFEKLGIEWSPIIETINENIKTTYLNAIKDTIHIQDFAKRFKINEQEAKNLLSYAIKSKLIAGYIIQDGKEFITSGELRKRLMKIIE